MTAPRSACGLDAATAVRMNYGLRLATLDDVPVLHELIARSIHGLGAADYTQAQSEAEAIRAGFSSFELMATLPGVRLYEKYGYVPGPAIDHPLPGGLTIRMVPMQKRVHPAPSA